MVEGPVLKIKELLSKSFHFPSSSSSVSIERVSVSGVSGETPI